MYRVLVSIGVLGTAALLASCGDRSVAQAQVEEAVLCPGGADCPADSNWVGLLMPADSFGVAAAPSGGTLAGGAAPAEAESVAAVALVAQSRQKRPKKLCPQGGHNKCEEYQSGIDWETQDGQIQCDASRPCVPGQAKDGDPMPAGYIGWLCKKSPTETCADIPQRR